jgi:metallo-beta-lactamase family protein
LAYIQFLGAAGTVTGSKHLINTGSDTEGKTGFQVLIDCGMFQGAKEWRLRNWQPTPVPAASIEAVILTHAHLDHCGWIPRLVREGFRGPVYATPSTIDLCGIILPDFRTPAGGRCAVLQPAQEVKAQPGLAFVHPR